MAAMLGDMLGVTHGSHGLSIGDGSIMGIQRALDLDPITVLRPNGGVIKTWATWLSYKRGLIAGLNKMKLVPCSSCDACSFTSHSSVSSLTPEHFPALLAAKI